MEEVVEVSCPYCGEGFTTWVDCSAGNQFYIEDCQICCRPINFDLQVDRDGLPSVVVSRDDE